MEINIPGVALVFEGGGMRAAYTAGFVTMLLENELNFPKVYGISAGSSHTVNYLSRDIPRARASFVDLVLDPQFGGWGSFLRGQGYFNAHHLYEGLIEQLAGTDEVMSFDFATFRDNPADCHIEAFDWETGETVAWTKADMPTPRDVGVRVRASSTMPIFMPPTEVAGRTYMDGGMGSSWGICLDAALADGFERLVVVRTQERAYRKGEMGGAAKTAFRALFRKHPLVAENTIERWRHYNRLLDRIDELEAEGRAFVFTPEKMDITNRETDYEKLNATYERGHAQALREYDRLTEWLQG
ncbi:MAG: patatin family protein [Eggerthellaceae bacterium]|nr:patatin family protein [Eggerthellaceae bacterium]